MNTQKFQKSGLTIIELLVVITIMVVLMAVMIPQVRMVSKDRSMREAARLVGSAFSDASSRATVDGFAGIAIARNPNIFRDDGPAVTNTVYYGGYSLFQLRQPPSFVGDTVGDTTTILDVIAHDYIGGVQGSFLVDITSANPNIDTTRGFVRLNNGKTLYRLDPVSGRCIVPFHLEVPAENMDGVPYELIRDPQLRQTSQIDLPPGYMINLNYSGPVDFYDSTNPAPAGSWSWDDKDWTWTAFSQSSINATEPVLIIFDDKGGIDTIYPNGFDSEPIRPGSSVHLCITPDEVKHSFQPGLLSDDMSDGDPNDVLDDPSVMWVTIPHDHSAVSISETVLPTTFYINTDTSEVIAQKKAARLLESLNIVSRRQLANQ